MNSRILSLLLLVCIVSSASPSIAEDAIANLRREIAGSPKSAPAVVTRVLKEAGPKAGLIAAPTVAAAIQALGREPTKRQISSIVYAAVRVVPDSVLPIVRAAIKVSSNACPEIAAAAVSALPNPWKQVHYQPPTASETNLHSRCATPIPGAPLTLAEAIVQAACEACSNSNLADLQAAVNLALSVGPTALFQMALNPILVSGVGIFGEGNEENEPHLPGAPATPPHSVKPPRPPPVPTPPPISP
jgi:hypothetical protein